MDFAQILHLNILRNQQFHKFLRRTFKSFYDHLIGEI